MSHDLVEGGDNWVLPIQGARVIRCHVDNNLTIQVSENEYQFDIRIENEFFLKSEGKEYKLVPEEPTTLGPVFVILNKTVNAALAYKDGKLCLNFSGGSILEVVSNVQYEAWEIIGSEGLRVVSLPGGGLSIWR